MAAQTLEQAAEADLAAVPQRWRKSLSALAVLLFLLSLAYLSSFVIRNWTSLKDLPPLKPWALVASAMLYLLAHPFTSSAWFIGLRSRDRTIGYPLALKIAFAAQVGKYLPGNVAHYFGRAALAKAYGVTLKVSGIITLLEIIAALLAALLVAALATMIDPTPISTVSHFLPDGLLLPALVASGALAGAGLFLHIAKVRPLVLTAATACLIVNFLLVGLSFMAVAIAVSGQQLSAPAMIGIFTMAWTAGYLLPGAPAGLGIREAVLVGWLGPLIGPGPAIACTLLHRIVTAAVDALVGLLGYAWLRAGAGGGQAFSKT